MKVTVVDSPSTTKRNKHYICNRAPLLANPLVKLPLGAVQPKGWLAHQLELMVEGMTGRLNEVSSFLAPDNGWLGGKDEGWEEQAYWFRGFYPLAKMTGDARCDAMADEWMEAILATTQPDGYYGPTYCKDFKSKNGKWKITDLWPHMVMNDALIQHHELTRDKRIGPLLTNFFGYCRDISDAEFIPALTRGIDVAPEFGEWTIAIQSRRAGGMAPQIAGL